MIFKRRSPRHIKWHRWFAWFPVNISDDEVAWLQYVERRAELLVGFDGGYWRWDYRAMIDGGVK